MAILPRRLLNLLALLTSASCVFLLCTWSFRPTPIDWTATSTFGDLDLDHDGKPPKIQYLPGRPKPAGSNYTKTLVMPRTQSEDVSWLDELPPDWTRAIYEVDNRRAALRVPKNKGHEAMVYLTYIIDHYDALPDIVVFAHSHRQAWHNSALLDLDTSSMLKTLNPARVQRLGFMNLRCQWFPGCPDWLHPGTTTADAEKEEQTLIARAWADLFPFDPLPPALGTPCCAQFAASAARLRAVPRALYRRFRAWLLHTPLRDAMSGRVWEYAWHYVLAGRAVVCPAEAACQCDAYGLCFADDAEHARWFALRGERDEANDRWLDWEEALAAYDGAVAAGRDPDAMRLARPTAGMPDVYADKIVECQQEMDRLLHEARERGRDPVERARIAGVPLDEVGI